MLVEMSSQSDQLILDSINLFFYIHDSNASQSEWTIIDLGSNKQSDDTDNGKDQ